MAAALALAACGPPPEADLTPSVPPDHLPRPELAPTAAFDGVMAQSVPDSERLAEETETLSARATSLRARAQALNEPILDPETRERLTGALDGAEP